MFRRLLIAATIVLVVVTIFASIIGCDKSNLPTAPTPIQAVCEDEKATNNGGPLPCTYLPGQAPLPPGQCWDPKATNYGGHIPCQYPPQGEVRIGLKTGFRDMKSGEGVFAEVPEFGYPGKVEARITLDDTSNTYPINHMLAGANGAPIRFEVVPIKGTGKSRLPHDGSSSVKRVWIKNAGTTTIPSGSVTFWYIAD